MHTIPVSLFVLVVLLCIATETHAARRLHFYAGGGYSWNLNTNITRIESQSGTVGRFAIGIDVNRSIDPDRMELLLELNSAFEGTYNPGVGFKLNFGPPEDVVNFHLAGTIGLRPQDKFRPWFGAFAGVEMYGLAFATLGIYSAGSDIEMPVMVGIRF